MMSEGKRSFLDKPGFEFIRKQEGWEVFRVRDVPNCVKVIISVRDTDTNEQKVGVIFIKKDELPAKGTGEYYNKLRKVTHLQLITVR